MRGIRRRGFIEGRDTEVVRLGIAIDIVHGWMLPSPTMPTFIRNPAWNGEIRKRARHDAHVDANLLDMARDCAWVLCLGLDQDGINCSR